MREILKQGAQGDLLVIRIRSLPKSAVKQETKGPIVLAHSETGHNHQIDATNGVTLFNDPADPLRCFLVMEGIEYADVVHHRSFDTHETLRVLGLGGGKRTVFEVRRQREYSPEGWRRAQD